MPGVPSGGFSNFLGTDGNIKLFTIHEVSPSQYPYPRSIGVSIALTKPAKLLHTKKELHAKLKADIIPSNAGH
jgi:hypothetical protein